LPTGSAVTAARYQIQVVVLIDHLLHSRHAR
jgi:hypothetical protein